MKNINDRAGIVSLSDTEIEMYGEQIAGGSFEIGNYVLAVGASVIAAATYVRTYGNTMFGSAAINVIGRFLNQCTLPYVQTFIRKLRDGYVTGSYHHDAMTLTLDNLEQGYGLNEAMTRAYKEA